MSTLRDAGLASLQKGDFQQAITQLEEACSAAQDDYHARQYLAAAYQQVDRHTDAVNTMVAAVTLQPADAQLRYNLGVVMERAGYPDQAREAYQQALQIQPVYPQAREGLTRLGGAAAPVPAQYGQTSPPQAQPASSANPYAAAPQQSAQGANPYALAPTQSAIPANPYSAPAYGAANPIAAAASPAAMGMTQCQVCATPGPVRSVSYQRNIGAIYLRFYKRIAGDMCENCAGKHFWEYTLTTLFLGWLGVISFIFSPFVIIGNYISYVRGASTTGKALSTLLILAYLAGWGVIITIFILAQNSR